jgi:hypothetical protein
MREQGKLRQSLAGTEALHHTLVLTQLQEGYVTGSNFKRQHGRHEGWTQHLYACRDGSNKNTYKNHAFRLEFQDGKRKRPSASDPERGPAEGRGAVHSHSIDCCDHIDTMVLEERMSATLPAELDDSVMHAYVKTAQYDWNGVSGWPVETDHAGFDLSLHHTEEDRASGLRAYITPLMRALGGSHMDVQHTDGRGNLLSYCSTYTPKFSDSFQEEFLNNQAGDFAVARKYAATIIPSNQRCGCIWQARSLSHADTEAHSWRRWHRCPAPPKRQNGSRCMKRRPGAAMRWRSWNFSARAMQLGRSCIR